jgi:hypothetical protein
MLRCGHHIESSIHYPDFPRFLAEVSRVLTAGGHFLYADARSRSAIAAWEAALSAAPLRVLSQTDITADILLGMERNSQRRLEGISRRMPTFLRGLAGDIAGVRDSRIYRDFEAGQLSYRLYQFVKPS